jgi:Putative ATPase subunit of terminase (gpP-like)
MPTKPNKNLDILNRRQQVAQLYLQNWTQAQIADQLGVRQPTISEDLKQIREQWRESGVRDFNEAREQELQKIDLLEREAWDAWQRSKKPMQSATVDGEGTRSRTKKTMRNQVGDPRFLDQVNKCIAQRRAILGLDALPSFSEQGTDVSITVDARIARVATIAATLRDRERVARDGAGPAPAFPGDVRRGDEPGQVADGSAPGLPGPQAD